MPKNKYFALIIILLSGILCFANSCSKSDLQGLVKENGPIFDPSQGGDTQKVLFIGNSLSYSNDMPSILKFIAKENGKNVEVMCNCMPNYALIDHWNDGSVHDILDRSYDLIIMQQGPSSQNEGRELLLEGGKFIHDYANDLGVHTSYFMVWPSVQYYFTFDGVIESYTLAAESTQSLLFPVGEVWKNYISQYDDYSMYTTDEFHPSKKGSFLAAWIIFKSLYPDSENNYQNSFAEFLTKEEFDRIVIIFAALK